MDINRDDDLDQTIQRPWQLRGRGRGRRNGCSIVRTRCMRCRRIGGGLDANVRFASGGISNGNAPGRQAVVDANVVDEPAGKSAAAVVLGRVKQHEMFLGGGLLQCMCIRGRRV